MNSGRLTELGWKPFFERQLEEVESAERFAARVCAHHGSHLLLLTKDGEASVPTKLAEACGEIAVGDWVLTDPANQRIMRRLDRQTELSRVAAGPAGRRQLIAANVDTIFVVSSCNQEFNLSRLERYLALAFETGATPVVVLTKTDLTDNSGQFQQQAQRLHPGLVVEALDSRDANRVSVLNDWCGPGKTVALLGSSGVGKSTLANTMGANQLPTGEIRDTDGKGRHTTTARSLHRISAGGWLLDNPGMREIQLTECEQGVAELFDDILQLAERCRFRDCNHRGDQGCAVVEAVESDMLSQRRLTSFLKLQAEQARNALSLMERHQRERKFGRMCKSIMSDKRKSRELH